VSEQTTARYTIGQRVRSTVDSQSAQGFPPEDAIPAGSLGTVDYVSTKHNKGYGVVFDNDRYKMSAWMRPDELEPVEENGQ
jgi:hypothetical protein